MNTDIKFISALFKIAVNLDSVNHKDTGNTREQDLEIINAGIIEIQKIMISYDCLKVAVKTSKVSKRIVKKATKLMTAEIERINGGKK